jgi:hypothetical protein|tara:strand:+ start:619 stop:1179 length:561 start_codon:yes stop_codon:yes gene_type:complete
MMSFKEFVMFILSLLAVIFISMNWSAKAEVEGLTDDLSGETAKVIAVVEGDTIYFEDGTKIKESEFSETVSKTEDVLDKLEKVELAKGKIEYNKIKIIEPERNNDQYCFVKVIIKQKGDTLIKEEILECADGRKTFDGPSYWELFAQFYYRDVSAPEYCRWYSRKKHAFKTPGKTCLQINGEWKVR